ncbi:MAG: EAL domain-containing protein [Candidatus Neoclostridium sp.]
MNNFLKKNGSKIAYSVALLLCAFFFIYFIMLGVDYSTAVESQAAERAAVHATSLAQSLEKRYARMDAETEFYASELAHATGEEEMKNRFKDVAATVRIADDTVELLYFTDDGIFNSYDEEITAYPELTALRNTQKTVQSELFQFGDHNMVVATVTRVDYPNPQIFEGSIKGIAVVYESEMLFISSVYSDSDDAAAEIFNKADFMFVCKGNGRIFDVVDNSDFYEINRNDFVKDVFSDIFVDSPHKDEAVEALSGNETKSFYYRGGSEEYVLVVLPFGTERGGVSLVCAYKASAVYDEGFAIKQTIWGSLVGLVCIVAVLVVTVILWSRSEKKRIYALEMIDSKLGCSTPKKLEKDVETLLKRYPSSSFAAVLLEIHNLTYFTEKFGEEGADNLKNFVTKTVRVSMRAGETFGYMGNGEFMLFMHFSDRKAFDERLSGMYLRISSFNVGEDYKVGVNFSVYEIDRERHESVTVMYEGLRHTRESANRRAKALNINYYDEILRENYIKKAEIETRMESALKNSEFHLFYQPKYNLRNKTLDGSEILIRWYDPKIDSYRLPSEFLPVFEENGFIVKIDRFVLYKACENIASRIAERKMCFPISINVSRVSAIQPDFVNYYVRIKKKFGIKDGFITLEFTESFAYEDYDYMAKIMGELHDEGFLCSIDDFGTGYSSYNLLKTITIDEIKLDSFFLSSGANPKRSETLLTSVIGMVKKLGMKVTQEGVETKEDLMRLEAIGCDVIQGYYFSKPLKYVDYLQFIDKNFIKK